ncbi:MAG: TetR/AcrR family transcriptional regulator [Polyangiaceae bacterium]|nr:TetR/AcrR family transcriptional regulator [Polyangiaceae bacterium]
MTYTGDGRRQRVVARTRAEILHAAARAFSRTGYRSVTMRAIADEAGYTAASLYTYFRSKEEIVTALRKLVREEFEAVIDEPPPSHLGFPDRFELLVCHLLEHAERRSDWFLLFLSVLQSNQHSAETKELPDALLAVEQTRSRVARWFEEHGNAQDLGHHDPSDLARFFSGVIQSFLASWLLEGTPPGGLTRRTAVIVELLLHGVTGLRDRNQPCGDARIVGMDPRPSVGGEVSSPRPLGIENE